MSPVLLAGLILAWIVAVVTVPDAWARIRGRTDRQVSP